ncbi:hypothetical protein HMPREF9465_02263 [Sutterella wadsworthensis 2_1_59BFAA]|uniref:Tyr recombinase domain-containing protein n=1 Tax=Sutterella wadsworthensis 2_1_59BFAA TaxID=742823 RepID=K1JU07_9BURK|nr:site-specific integrase [Sutterella wadsworthensis]EKB30133.1 hypothetical protein HMPREF9465_02263 [Sutterella wadsworthensis 2_1_59BFAA]
MQKTVIACCVGALFASGTAVAATHTLGDKVGIAGEGSALTVNTQTQKVTDKSQLIGGWWHYSVAVADAVWKRLAVWLEARAGDPCPNVFLAVRRYGRISTGHSITSSAVYQILKTRSSQSGVEDFSPHDLRRTFATRLLGAGTDINLVRKAMGHASVLTTQRYDKREDEEVEEATRKILI